MSADTEFPGAYGRLFAEFVEHKRSLGLLYDARAVRQVRMLAAHVASYPVDAGVMTPRMAEAFTDQKDKKPATVWKYRSLAAQFARFLLERGIDCWRPPEYQGAMPVPRFAPRIITPSEAGRLIACADRLAPHPSSPFAPLVYGMILRVLWCCGTRIGETLELRVADVDTADAVLTIRRAKGGKTRLVPMPASLNTFAASYLGGLGIEHDPGAWVFPNLKGGRLSYHTASGRIRNLMRAADITTGAGNPARTHDLRHSYAVNALAQMQSKGMDTYTCLPLLSAFMGHEAIRHTEYYLRLTPGAATRIADEQAAAHGGVYPEVD
jgi:integrase